MEMSKKEEDCGCGLTEDGTWSDEVFDRYGCGCEEDVRHGSPEDRGHMDAYYGRDPQPHYFEGDTLQSVKRTDLSCQEYLEYYQGYNNCTDRKDWG